jgi:hypothetical protein
MGALSSLEAALKARASRAQRFLLRNSYFRLPTVTTLPALVPKQELGNEGKLRSWNAEIQKISRDGEICSRS